MSGHFPKRYYVGKIVLCITQGIGFMCVFAANILN